MILSVSFLVHCYVISHFQYFSIRYTCSCLAWNEADHSYLSRNIWLDHSRLLHSGKWKLTAQQVILSDMVKETAVNEAARGTAWWWWWISQWLGGSKKDLTNSQWRPCALPEKFKPWFHVELSENGSVAVWQTEICYIHSAAAALPCCCRAFTGPEEMN